MSETIVSEAEAVERLPDLIDRALAGEEVRITREGGITMELRPAPPPARRGQPISKADLDWLQEHRVGKHIPAEDAGTLVSRMRDEDWS